MVQIKFSFFDFSQKGKWVKTYPGESCWLVFLLWKQKVFIGENNVWYFPGFDFTLLQN